MKTKSSRALALAAAATLTGCAAQTTEPSGMSTSDLRSDVSVEGTLLIAFDGTGNYLAQNDVIAQMFTGVATTGGDPIPHSYQDSAHAFGAKADQDWAYVSYASSDDFGRVRSLYYNGPPEGATSLGFEDSGASFIYDEAMRDGPLGELCKAVADAATKKVFLVGYSRGAVMAHRAAIAIMGGACGDGMGAKVTWLGLVDPVASGMDQDHVATEDCTDDASRYQVRDNAQTEGCLALVRSTSTGAPVPVSVLMKTTEANIAADDFLLSTIPVNGARVKVFDFAGTAVSVHVAMGRSGIVETALRAEGANVGGLRYR